MRIWTLHPKYLDSQGLVALWREALLAQKVLLSQTRGYRRHPQLERFREQPDPIAAIVTYLRGVQREAAKRGYRFDATRIGTADIAPKMEATTGQVRYEWGHLLNKLHTRSPELYLLHAQTEQPEVHPLFYVVPGPVAAWERTG